MEILVLVIVLLCVVFRIAFNPMTVFLTLEVQAPELHQRLPKHDLQHSVLKMSSTKKERQRLAAERKRLETERQCLEQQHTDQNIFI